MARSYRSQTGLTAINGGEKRKIQSFQLMFLSCFAAASPACMHAAAAPALELSSSSSDARSCNRVAAEHASDCCSLHLASKPRVRVSRQRDCRRRALRSRKRHCVQESHERYCHWEAVCLRGKAREELSCDAAPLLPCSAALLPLLCSSPSLVIHPLFPLSISRRSLCR